LSRAGAALLPGRLVAGAVALGCGVLAFALAVHHPVLGALTALPLAMALAMALGAGAWAPGVWPLSLLPLLPLVGGMPWTAWLVVEELDLRVLAVAAGGVVAGTQGWLGGASTVRWPPRLWIHTSFAPASK
jgi:hypothetical protein